MFALYCCFRFHFGTALVGTVVKLVTNKPNSIIYASKQFLQKLVDRTCLQVLSRRIQANDSRTAVMGHDIDKACNNIPYF